QCVLTVPAPCEEPVAAPCPRQEVQQSPREPQGKFGTVYRLQEKATGRIRAGKYFRARTAKERQAARAEVELMNLLHHPCLVQCLEAFQEPTQLVMVMEYVAGGELFERIVDDDFEHTEPSSAQYMQQILEGLQFMHGQAIVHLDLKPENIVCVSPGSHRVKIIDFGLAWRLEHQELPVKVLHGTPEFMAPEVVAFEPVSFSTDMWSVGVICYILLSGESPFQGDTDMETLSNVTAAQWDFEEETFSEISQQAKDFIRKVLPVWWRSPHDPPCVCCSRRLPSAGALLHPWLQQPQPSSPKVLNKERIRQFLARRKWQVPAGVMGTLGCPWWGHGDMGVALPKGSVPLVGTWGHGGDSAGGLPAPDEVMGTGGGAAEGLRALGEVPGRAHPALCNPELIPMGVSCSSPFPLPISCRPGEGAALQSSAPTRCQPLRSAARPGGRGGGGWWERCSLRAVTVWPCHPILEHLEMGMEPPHSSQGGLASLGHSQTLLG
uniref:Uncharacterized protein n=1 Tax=Geospiza parvula TaxID=87175 RepID=A0A8C3NBA4_GEOPR